LYSKKEKQVAKKIESNRKFRGAFNRVKEWFQGNF